MSLLQVQGLRDVGGASGGAADRDSVHRAMQALLDDLHRSPHSRPFLFPVNSGTAWQAERPQGYSVQTLRSRAVGHPCAC